MANAINIIKSLPVADVKRIIQLFRGIGYHPCDDDEIFRLMGKKYPISMIHTIIRTYLGAEFDFEKYFNDMEVK